MANVKKALYNVAVFLVSLFITGSINVSNIKNTQDTSRVTLTVNETETLQEMNGWGAAAAWWAQVAGGSKNADDIAKLLYSKEGLGLNIYRYNVGSGEKQNPNSRLDPDSWKSTASFLVYNEKTGKYEYDWSQDANAMNMLKLCMSYGCIDSVVLFSNSPHFSMTVSGQASGGLKKHQNNLKPECYQEYVDYFLDITEHFLELGVPVKYISPINEPLVSWGGDNVYQEGCHYDEKEMFKLYRMFAKSIKERGLNVKMSMCEVSKIGNPAFEYIKKISKDEELSSVMATYSYHSYWSDTNYLLKKAWGQYLRKYYPDVTSRWTSGASCPATARRGRYPARVPWRELYARISCIQTPRRGPRGSQSANGATTPTDSSSPTMSATNITPPSDTMRLRISRSLFLSAARSSPTKRMSTTASRGR